MSSKLKSTRNNPVSIELKKEPEEEEVQIVEILEQTNVNGVHYNSIQIPFKKESNNYLTSNPIDFSVLNEKIKHLETVNKSLLKTIELKSNENDLLKQNEIKLITENNKLKLRLSRYEACEHNRSIVLIEQIESNFKQEPTVDLDDGTSTSESDINSNQSDDETTNRVKI